MQPNELILDTQAFDAQINGMDKTCLLAPINFFYACNVPDPKNRIKRMESLRARALALGISEEEFAAARDKFTSQYDSDPNAWLHIARMSVRRQVMQEFGMTPMADIIPREAEYLIEPYLPLGAITILAGVAGTGKTWLALKWAADISTGRAVKDGTPGLVYYFTQENDPSIVLSPRLAKLGANQENIIAMSPTSDAPSLTMCDPRLDALAARPGFRPSLVVFDPIQSYLGKNVKMNQADDVRPMMDHLARFAARYQCAVMLVSHINKPSLASGSASDRILGSSDFRNAARSIIFVGNDPDNKDTRVFAHDKNSLGPTGPSRRFAVTENGVTIMDICDFTADEIIRPHQPGPRGPMPLARDRAVALLGEMMKNTGWVKVTDACKAAKREAIGRTTLYDAANEMRLKASSYNKGQKGGYTVWHQPDREPPDLAEQLELTYARA